MSVKRGNHGYRLGGLMDVVMTLTVPVFPAFVHDHMKSYLPLWKLLIHCYRTCQGFDCLYGDANKTPLLRYNLSHL